MPDTLFPRFFAGGGRPGPGGKADFWALRTGHFRGNAPRPEAAHLTGSGGDEAAVSRQDRGQAHFKGTWGSESEDAALILSLTFRKVKKKRKKFKNRFDIANYSDYILLEPGRI